MVQQSHQHIEDISFSGLPGMVPCSDTEQISVCVVQVVSKCSKLNLTT